ncbi:MAG: hypothetical protein ABI165_09030, partial [Bryobacteraceae bacterium]
MVFLLRHRIQFVILFVTLAVQVVFGLWVLAIPRVRLSRRLQTLTAAVVLLLSFWLCAAALLDFARIARS